MRKRFGDTLVEVTLAVGIFSMVAIAVVSVVSGSISDAQGALELTVTREEIDSQAEALRFIHGAYVSAIQSDASSADRSSAYAANRSKYQLLWRAITERANGNVLLQPLTDSCADYNNAKRSGQIEDAGALTQQKAFAIDTKNLGASITEENNASSIIITPTEDEESLFKEASTYPRLVYDDSDAADLLDNETTTKLTAVEGIHIVAVSDKTNNQDGKGNYYDFYIRTCWYGVGATTPSTISTVVRLYDPEAIK